MRCAPVHVTFSTVRYMARCVAAALVVGTLIAGGLVPSPAHAEAPAATSPTTATAPTLAKACADFGPASASRKALIIGNADYRELNTLSNPTRDADKMKDSLATAGFAGLVCKNLPSSLITVAVDHFVNSLQKGDVALFYYSGHGSEIEGANHLYGVDYGAKRKRTYAVQSLLTQLQGRGASELNIVILDACRSDPSKNLDIEPGFVPEKAPAGTYIAFATAPGETASDGVPDTNSPFTAALAARLVTPGVELDFVFRDVRQDVLAATTGRQMTWSTSSILGRFYFIPSEPVAR